MKRTYITLFYILTDAVFAVSTLYIALLLHFDTIIPSEILNNIMLYSPVIISSFWFFSFVLSCYDELVRYTGFSELFRQLIAVCLLTVFMFFLTKIGMLDIPVSVVIMMACLLFMATGGSRALPRIASRFQVVFNEHFHQTKRVLLVGAGDCGAMLIKRLLDNVDKQLCPVACVDDDPAKKNLRICGVKVFGTTEDIVKVVRKCRVDEIIIAIPSAGAKPIRNIYEKCIPVGLPVSFFQTVIDIEEFMQGKKSALKEVSLEDLLCRESVCADSPIAQAYINGKTVLVTGGAGSIGSELCRQALRNGCKKLIVFDICENSLFELNEELKSNYLPGRYELALGSVRDKNRLYDVFTQYKPQLVFHAAAHKHVPLSELNPFEVAKNNVFGTKNVIDVSKKAGVEKFILISTDKAVNPTNVMGASKRIAEMLVQSDNCIQTEMAAVRFGNVLGSNGSVVPIFKRQIAAGGPVTITHPDIERYFMTIPEAVSLVQTAAALAHGGETFVLNMGEPIKILDMAKDLIRLSGLEPGHDIEIEFTGLRDGEKLFEELSLDSESVDSTSHAKIFIMRSPVVDQLKLYRNLAKIRVCIDGEKNMEQIRSLLFNTIKEEPEDERLSGLTVN